MENLIFVVNLIDFAYKNPTLKVSYAGGNMNEAYSVYNKLVSSSDRTQVTLELVQGKEAKRLETHRCPEIQM